MVAATPFDAIIIGTGQAGPPLAGRLAKAGQKVAIIERASFGGTCVNNGCIPTKTLIASARTAYVARRAADFGINIAGPISVDMKVVKARKDQVSGASRTGLEGWLKTAPGITVFTGQARFVADHEVAVEGARLTANRIFINTGGRPTAPPIPGLDTVPYLTNVSMMDVDFLPRHLVIIGGSYIGLEFAQMYRRFGSEVTVFEDAPKLIQHEDADISDGVRDILTNEGIDIRLNATNVWVSASGGDIEVQSSSGASVVGTHLLVATGRRPNTDDLGLETTGIVLDGHGFIKTNDMLETTVPGVWALGDCNGKGAFTHTSYNDFEIVAANLLDSDPRRVSDRILAYNLYTDPPLGRCGMTESDVRKTGRPALIGRRPMTKVGRAVEKGESQGFMKILVDAETKLILGAAILGVEGDEAIHCILDIMYAKAPYTVLQRATNIHPTVSELIPTVLGELHPL